MALHDSIAATWLHDHTYGHDQPVKLILCSMHVDHIIPQYSQATATWLAEALSTTVAAFTHIRQSSNV